MGSCGSGRREAGRFGCRRRVGGRLENAQGIFAQGANGHPRVRSDGQARGVGPAHWQCGAIAAAIGSKRLLLLTDVAGILDAEDTLIEKINSKETYKLIDDGVISGGMIPKATTCLQAVEKGVDAAVILDGRVAHAILLELFTDHGVGTLISRE